MSFGIQGIKKGYLNDDIKIQFLSTVKFLKMQSQGKNSEESL